MTYSPLMDLVCHRLPLNEINQIAAKYHKSAAQVILRWNIERGCYPLPRTKKLNGYKKILKFLIFNSHRKRLL